MPTNAPSANALGGWLTDRIGPQRALMLLGCVQAASLAPLTLLPLPLIWLGVWMGLWSASCWAFMVPQQARLARLAPPLTPVLFALNAAAIYLGASLGSAGGGITLRLAGFAALGPAGAVLVLLGIGSLWLVARMPAAESQDAL